MAAADPTSGLKRGGRRPPNVRRVLFRVEKLLP
jgi:hypothetical protein